jgi:hypothetical protein
MLDLVGPIGPRRRLWRARRDGGRNEPDCEGFSRVLDLCLDDTKAVVLESRSELGRGHLRHGDWFVEARHQSSLSPRSGVVERTSIPALTPNKHVELLPGRPLIGSNPGGGNGRRTAAGVSNCQKCQPLTELFRDHVLAGKCGDGPDFSTLVIRANHYPGPDSTRPVESRPLAYCDA